MKNDLAIFGGLKSIPTEPNSFKWISKNDINRVGNLLASQQISGFIAQPGSQHLGGTWVQELERIWSERINGGNGVGFNSWTSGLEAIFQSLDCPGASEVIVPAWTMSATVAAIVNAGLQPVFCDIDPDSFNLDPEKVASLINKNTVAICSVDIFGRPCEIHKLREIAELYSLKLISDSAQCPIGTIDGVHTSSISDMGGFSLNRHKHIQAGEGGLVVTKNNEYLDRLRALRNHGESAHPELTIGGHQIYGHNWRLGEVEALLAVQQFRRIDELVNARREAGKWFSSQLSQLIGITIPSIPQNIEHDYYILGMIYDQNKTGVKRSLVAKALRSEGIQFLVDEYSNVHNLPAFLKFRRGPMEITEKYNSEKFLGLYLCGHDFDDELRANVVNAFQKVWANLEHLN